MENKLEVIEFIDGEFRLDVSVAPSEETVWLTIDQMSELFNKNKSTISRHISNIFTENELEEITSVAKIATQLKRYDPRTKRDRVALVDINYYNLDVIISVGYRVKSKEGIIFRKWANNILKQYMLKGYVVDVQKYDVPTIENITNILEKARKSSGCLQITGDDMLDFLLVYNKGLTILDNYDHQTMKIDSHLDDTYIINYDECIKVIHETQFDNKGDLFGLEKSEAFKSAIETIYQTFDRKELYPSLEDKAANLLYLITKNHAFT